MAQSVRNEKGQVVDAGIDLNQPDAFGEYVLFLEYFFASNFECNSFVRSRFIEFCCTQPSFLYSVYAHCCIDLILKILLIRKVLQ